MKSRFFVLTGLLVCLALAAPAGAADKGWHLRVFAAGFDSDVAISVGVGASRAVTVLILSVGRQVVGTWMDGCVAVVAVVSAGIGIDVAVAVRVRAVESVAVLVDAIHCAV